MFHKEMRASATTSTLPLVGHVPPLARVAAITERALAVHSIEQYLAICRKAMMCNDDCDVTVPTYMK